MNAWEIWAIVVVVLSAALNCFLWKTKLWYLRCCAIYNFKRFTGQHRKYPEIKGMSYRQYYKTHVKHAR